MTYGICFEPWYRTEPWLSRGHSPGTASDLDERNYPARQIVFFSFVPFSNPISTPRRGSHYPQALVCPWFCTSSSYECIYTLHTELLLVGGSILSLQLAFLIHHYLSKIYLCWFCMSLNLSLYDLISKFNVLTFIEIIEMMTMLMILVLSNASRCITFPSWNPLIELGCLHWLRVPGNHSHNALLSPCVDLSCALALHFLSHLSRGNIHQLVHSPVNSFQELWKFYHQWMYRLSL